MIKNIPHHLPSTNPENWPFCIAACFPGENRVNFTTGETDYIFTIVDPTEEELTLLDECLAGDSEWPAMRDTAAEKVQIMESLALLIDDSSDTFRRQLATLLRGM